jgi:GT2 family glycosyltransferase
VFGVSGAACLVPRDVYEELGGLDADFFASHEDVDFSYRAQLRGYRVVYVPDAIVRHAGSATMGHMSARQVFYGQRNLEWVYLKNTPASLLLRTLPAHALYVCASAVHFASVGRLAPFLLAKWAALRGAPAMWRKRRAVQRTRRSDPARMARLMERHWMALKWREKAFDRRVARRA